MFKSCEVNFRVPSLNGHANAHSYWMRPAMTETGQCDFWGENQLNTGAVLKCFPPFVSLITLR